MEFVFIYSMEILGALTSSGAVAYYVYKVRGSVARQEEPVSIEPLKEKKPSWDSVTAKTRERLFGRLFSILNSKKDPAIDGVLEQVEEVLYTSDLGSEMAEQIMVDLKDGWKKEEAEVSVLLRSLSLQRLKGVKAPERFRSLPEGRPYVIFVVGVNGAGKTTTIGKLAHFYAEKGLKVLVAAGDTFRAAAQSQLRVWTERAAVEIFDPPDVAEPSAVAHKALSYAVQKELDVVLVDTAGRLHTQGNLMAELAKMNRVMGKVVSGAPHDTLLVLDANSGQNALVQAEQFHQAVGVTGVVVTKLDGSAKGGFIFALHALKRLPIVFIGVGEQVSDLMPFDAERFVSALFPEITSSGEERRVSP